MSQQNAPQARVSWTTDLSSSLSIWKKIAIFFGLLALILPGVLLYLYWSKTMKPTLVSDGVKLALYEEAGRKASPKVTRYYYNPSAVSTIHGYTAKTRSLPLLVITVFAAIVGINLLIDGSFVGIILAIGLFLIFFLVTKKISVVAINAEPLDRVSPTSGGGSILLLLLSPFLYLIQLVMGTDDEAVPLVKRVNEVSLKQSGNVSLGKNRAMVFGGIDEQARMAVQEMEENFKYYL